MTKNIGIDIPYDLGYAWKIKDWEIPPIGGDSIIINHSHYSLDGNYNLLFRNMNESYLQGYDGGEQLRLDWNNNLNYAVKMFGNGIQENFYVATLINAGKFDSGVEKQTTFQWIDADYSLYRFINL